MHLIKTIMQAIMLKRDIAYPPGRGDYSGPAAEFPELTLTLPYGMGVAFLQQGPVARAVEMMGYTLMKFFPVGKAATLAALFVAMTASSSAPRAMPSPNRTAPTGTAARETIDDAVSTADVVLMFVSGGGVLALQLRRKQKALNTTRLTTRTT
jgi:hypothetical protein